MIFDLRSLDFARDKLAIFDFESAIGNRKSSILLEDTKGYCQIVNFNPQDLFPI